MIDRTSHNYFDQIYPIEATIQFQEWTQLDPLKVNHKLNFEKREQINSYFFEAGTNMWDLKEVEMKGIRHEEQDAL